MSQKKQTVEEYHEILKRYAERRGLIFNPDEAIVLPLVEGLLTNKERYGHSSCPCRLASGDLKKDRDIICPCEYAAPDIEEYGQCYCGLYVSREVAEGSAQPRKVPERRPPEKMF